MESFLEPRNDKVSFKLQLNMRWKQRHKLPKLFYEKAVKPVVKFMRRWLRSH